MKTLIALLILWFLMILLIFYAMVRQVEAMDQDIWIDETETVR